MKPVYDKNNDVSHIVLKFDNRMHSCLDSWLNFQLVFATENIQQQAKVPKFEEKLVERLWVEFGAKRYLRTRICHLFRGESFFGKFAKCSEYINFFSTLITAYEFKKCRHLLMLLLGFRCS